MAYRRRTYRRRYRRYRRPPYIRRRRRIIKRRNFGRNRRYRPRSSKANSRRVVTIDRSINFLGDTAIATFKDTRLARVFTGQISGTQPAGYGLVYPNANTYYQGVVIPGNYLFDTNIPNLDEYENRFLYCEVIRSTIVVTFTNSSEYRPKTVGVTLLPPNTVPGNWLSTHWSDTKSPAEQPHTTARDITTTSGSRPQVKIVGSTNNKAAFGASNASTSNATRLSTGSMTVAPTQSYIWYFW